mmetsp:Transcript_1725/g.2367  ORF Transcript_1725/g.2367 Transcript_1725/m.2367 type:complete len:455 (-) Transcript_1725:46-1410(-)
MKDSQVQKVQKVHQKEHGKKDNMVFIVVEKNAEWMDIALTSRVFCRFNMGIKYIASSSGSVPLTRNGKIKPDMTFDKALEDSCKILVLPGGSLSVSTLMEDPKFNEFLKQHIEQQPGSLVAAMGASATEMLPSFGYVDRLGPTCYPLHDTGVVVREYQNRIWTAPGLGSATELALALGEYMYGHDRAKSIADSIGYGDTTIVHINSPTKQAPDEASSRMKQWAKEEDYKTVRKIFWNEAWSKMEKLGWTCDLDETSGSCVFLPPDGFGGRILGSICFDSVYSVLEDLWKHPETKTSKQVGRIIDYHLGRKKREASIAIGKKQTKERRKSEAELDLFLHVVWTRLEPLGWTISDNNAFVTPSNHYQHKELKSREETIKYLLTDPALRMDHNILAIVDLYQNCQRFFNMKEAFGHKSAAEIEMETKKRMPALAWNLWKRDASKVRIEGKSMKKQDG